VFSSNTSPFHKMNSKSVSALTLIIAAAALLPVNAVGASITVAVTGILWILLSDYGRTIEPLRVLARPLPFPSQASGLRQAA
jgi:hypothetical protein